MHTGFDPEFLIGDLRQHRFKPLAVQLDANHQNQATISQDGGRRLLVLQRLWLPARVEADSARAVGGLFGEAGEADADQSAIELDMQIK